MSLFSLFGCLPHSASPNQKPDFDEIASRIVEAFEQDSIEPIEDLLSQSALNTGDLYKGVRYSSELLKGEKIVGVEKKSKVEGAQYIGGKSDKYFSCNYFVKTEQNTYRLSFQFFAKNTIYPEDQGIYRIYFSKESDYINKIERFKEDKSNSTGELHWNYGATYERAGIYNPEWQTTPPPEDYTNQRY